MMRWCRISVGQKIHAECSSNGYPRHHLGTVFGQSGHLLSASAPPCGSRPPTKAVAAKRESCSAEDLCRNSVQNLSSVLPPSWRVGSYSHWSVVRLVMVRPRASRSSSHRDEWLDVAWSGTLLWLSSFFFSAPHLFVYLSLLLRQRRSVDVAASLKPTVAASAERSRASFEIGHGHSGTQFFASGATRRRDTWWCTS